MSHQRYELQPIGWVESPLVNRAVAPKQGDEGSPDAWLAFDARFSEGLRGLQVGVEVIVLTWLDRAQRDVLVVHPRGDPANPLQGVFNTACIASDQAADGSSKIHSGRANRSASGPRASPVGERGLPQGSDVRYSVRSAAAGSVRAARRAGKYAAISTTPSSTAAPVIKTAGSTG